MNVRLKKCWLACGFVLATAPLAQAQDSTSTDLGVARYDGAGALHYPADTDTWVMMGASLGGDYAEAAFDPASPGSLGVVQMEPSAYRHFLEHNEYADGTMFLLTFYHSESKSVPQLQGFVQGEVTAREIHVIDKARYADGRAFFFYNAGQDLTSMLEAGNECVQCHEEHGRYDGSFTQFYPPLRQRR